MHATTAATQLLNDRYELGPVIGRGGMAEVREAYDTATSRVVAIKRLRPDLAHDPRLVRRFVDEVRIASRVSHPNLVAVLDHGAFLGVPYLVLERLRGETLRDRLDRGRLTIDAARDLALQLLAALVCVHRAGIVHLDASLATSSTTRVRGGSATSASPSTGERLHHRRRRASCSGRRPTSRRSCCWAVAQPRLRTCPRSAS
jgi:aminoglycoside phosphotransferase (APT) family kinase protein